MPLVLAHILFETAYTAHGNLPTSTDEQKLYAWLLEKYLDLYSIDSTWDDLDSTSLDSLTHIEQLDSYSGSMAGGITEVLTIGTQQWYFPDFDSTFVLPDSTDTLEEEEIEERIANGGYEPYSPLLQNKEDDGFSLYPNPTSGNFIIENTRPGGLVIMTLDGRKLAEYKTKNGRNEIMLPKGLAAGAYLIRYEPIDGQREVNRKLIYQP